MLFRSIIDGGLTQLRAAKEVLSSLYLDIPVVSLKKDSAHKTDSLILSDESVHLLDRHHPMYVLLSRIQEEAHRFAITFHREKQSKQIYQSILDAIPGIGNVSKKKLLEKYKTITAMKQATDDDLKQLGLNQQQIKNLRIAFLSTENQIERINP